MYETDKFQVACIKEICESEKVYRSNNNLRVLKCQLLRSGWVKSGRLLSR